MTDINQTLIGLLGGLFAALVAGSIVRLVALRHSEPQLRAKRLGSLRVWWTLAVLLTVAVLFGRLGASLILALAGILGLREFLNLIGYRDVGWLTLAVAFGSIPLQYALIAGHHDIAARTLLPVGMMLLVSTTRLMRGETHNYIRSTAATFWAVMLLVYCLSHAALLFIDTAETRPMAGSAGWFLFVVIITEMDDIAQALVGRRIGRHRITPRISPNKTWEGFAGGVVTSVLLSLLLSPWLTTFPPVTTPQGLLTAVSAGLLIVIAAFLGDINMSAIKRDAGVKDGSTLLPGMGGIIDRVDSLTFTAPAFYYFVRFLS